MMFTASYCYIADKYLMGANLIFFWADIQTICVCVCVCMFIYVYSINK